MTPLGEDIWHTLSILKRRKTIIDLFLSLTYPNFVGWKRKII